jgi:hypothetical protein
MIQVTVDVQDSVYDGIEQFAKDRGLNVAEGVKWLLGDFVHHNVSRIYPLPPSQLSAVQAIPATPPVDFMAIGKFLLDDYLKKNNVKCPHCQASLTVKDLEANGCSSCNKKIV